MYPCFLHLYVILLLLLLPARAAGADGFTGADLTMDVCLPQSQGHAFCPYPITIFANHKVLAASFAVNCFVLSSTKELFNALPAPYVGLFNMWNNGGASNLLALEIDTFQNSRGKSMVCFSLRSIAFHGRTAGYYTFDGVFQPLSLTEHTKLNVTYGRETDDDEHPLNGNHHVYGSLPLNGEAALLNYSAILVLALVVKVHVYMKRRKHAEWEIELGPPSFKYKDLVAATNGFKDKMLLGTGGFGRVYKGVMPLSKQVVVIKRVSPESKQGMKEFLYKKAMSKPRETVQESYEQESRISDKDSDEEHATPQKQHEIMELDVDSNTNRQADSRVSMLLSESSSHMVNPVGREPAGMVESYPLSRSSVAASSKKDGSDDSSTTARDLRFELLEKITGGFSKEHEIGSGGYGKVYKGVLNGKEIAVKKLHWHLALDDVIFKNEFENLMRVRHQNIVELVGYCYEIRHRYVEHNGRNVYAEMVDRVLCFEYLQNGSLDKHLYEEHRGLDWCTRYKIIKGICEGLNYLHGLEESILHLDLKPANILLDENMVPKIADFGLSRLFGGTHTHITKNLAGTDMYMPPEYLTKRIITKKYDVFSLGVIIIQIITGRDGFFEYWEMMSSKYRVQQFIELVHQNWKVRVEATSMHTSAGENCKQVKRCIEIALNCVEIEREKRPTIGDIIHKLRETETMTQEVPMPFSQESGNASSSHFKTEMVHNWSQEKQRGGQVKDSSNQQRKVLQKQSGMQQKDLSNEQPGSLEKEYQQDTKKHAASGYEFFILILPGILRDHVVVFP